MTCAADGIRRESSTYACKLAVLGAVARIDTTDSRILAVPSRRYERDPRGDKRIVLKRGGGDRGAIDHHRVDVARSWGIHGNLLHTVEAVRPTGPFVGIEQDVGFGGAQRQVQVVKDQLGGSRKDIRVGPRQCDLERRHRCCCGCAWDTKLIRVDLPFCQRNSILHIETDGVQGNQV